jgi:hypothetical protein
MFDREAKMMHSFSEHFWVGVFAKAFYENVNNGRMPREFYPAVGAGWYGCEVPRVAPRYESFEAPCGNPDTGNAALCSAVMVG